MARAPLVAVCGASAPTSEQLGAAEEVGSLLARRGCVVVCGGLTGVMAAVARGTRRAGGVCIGLLPGDDDRDANEDVTIALPTGMGEMRNALIARCSAGMIVIGGGYGTLSEIALALRLHRPVVALDSWQLQAPAGEASPARTLLRATSPDQAVILLLREIGAG